MSVLELRPYQQGAVDSVFEYWGDGQGSPLIVLPTGTGKSLVIAEICRLCLEYPNTKILVAAHIKELIEQNYEELMSLWPGAPAGIYSAGAGRRDTDDQIIFCSIQSIFRPRVFTKFGRVDIILIDEAHLIPMCDAGMYRSLLNGLRMVNPDRQVVGLTATPYRLDSGRLDEGDNRFFERVCYDYPIREAIDEGYLCPPTSKPTETLLDTKGVGTRGGEFIAGELEEHVNIAEVNEAVVDEAVGWGLAEDRKSWLFFCAGVKHSEAIAAVVRARGISCEVITGKTPKADRKRIIEDFKAGKIRALASMNVLTTGFNARAVDLIAMLRPTQSAGLYVQMVGRGTRLSPETGKVNCRVLDFAGNIGRFGPIDDVKIKKPGPGGGEAPFKICPECGEICATATRTCRCCGFAFPPPALTLDVRASKLAILSEKGVTGPDWFEVVDVGYNVHNKADRPPSMRVTYLCEGGRRYSTWVCLQHGGFATGQAKLWWKRTGGEDPIPLTTAEALARVGELVPPARIKVTRKNDFDSVVATDGVLELRPSVIEGVPVGFTYAEDDIPF